MSDGLTAAQRAYREEYLASEHWQQRRAEALDFAEHRCQICNREQNELDEGSILDVHHRTYERIGRERLADLTVLCRACHARFHERLGGVECPHCHFREVVRDKGRDWCPYCGAWVDQVRRLG